MRRGSVSIGIALIVAALSLNMARTSQAAIASDTTPKQVEVNIDNFSFLPAVITVPAGTTIRWTNRDDIPHTVVSDDHSTFKSKPLDTGDTFSYTFTKPGIYSYFCSIHPKMTGKVVVQ